MITANNLTFNFTTEALLFENVNFKLSPKQRVALIGDNGSVNLPYLIYWLKT